MLLDIQLLIVEPAEVFINRLPELKLTELALEFVELLIQNSTCELLADILHLSCLQTLKLTSVDSEGLLLIVAKLSTSLISTLFIEKQNVVRNYRTTLLSLWNLIGKTKLTTLSMRECGLSEEHVLTIEECINESKLKVLDLSENRFKTADTTILISACSRSSVKRLDLTYQSFSASPTIEYVTAMNLMPNLDIGW